MLQLAMDANFQLKSKLRGTSSQDPTLGLGWSYFVGHLPYSNFIKNYVDEDEVNTSTHCIVNSVVNGCVRFRVVLGSKPFSICWQRNQRGLGQQHWQWSAAHIISYFVDWELEICKRENGESIYQSNFSSGTNIKHRQCNIDYIFSSSVTGAGMWYLTISYDVRCQWFTNFWKHLRFLPAVIRFLMPLLAVCALVPKFHLQSHKKKCHMPFSYNYQKGVGWTEGEGVEQHWDWLNPQGVKHWEIRLEVKRGNIL